MSTPRSTSVDRARPARAPLFLLPLALALFGAGCAATSEEASTATLAAPSTPAERVQVQDRLIAMAREDNRVQAHLQVLCEQIGPRLTGSTNYERAAEWARDELAGYGLDARLERWGEVPVGFDRGPWWGGLVSTDPAPADFAPIEYDFITPAWTPGTRGAVRGKVVPYPTSDEELASIEALAAGSWVLRPSGEGAPRLSREWRAEVDAALVELGALGEIRSSGSQLVRTSGSFRIDPEELPKLVRIVLRDDQHQDLEDRLGRGETPVCEFDVQNTFRPGPIEQVNVVADLVGTTKADEYVIVCGHLDSWDGASGAVDNGTGVSTAMEAARLLSAAGVRPQRTIRFILWGGEEQGLLGSRAYVEQNERILHRISAVLNHDGGTNYLSGLLITPEMRAQLEEACGPLLDLDPEMPFELVVQDSLSGSSSSDHAPFVRAGVPGFFWNQSGRFDYRHHHHTQHDHFEAAIPEYQEHSALVVALAAYGIAELPELLDRRNMEPLPPRRMGVQLDGTKVTQVTKDSKAAAAGWAPGDVILTVDGAEVDSSRAVVAALQKGGPVKPVVLDRGGQRLTTTLDYSGDEAERERLARRSQREAAGLIEASTVSE